MNLTVDGSFQTCKGVAPIGSGDVAVAQVNRVVVAGLACAVLAEVEERLAERTAAEVASDQPDRVRSLMFLLCTARRMSPMEGRIQQ